MELIHSKTTTLTPTAFNSLAPGRFQFNFRKVIFKLTEVNGGWGISYEIALRWMPLDFADDQSTLVQVMAWCCQATSHYLSQCWPRSMSPYGVTRPHWVNSLRLQQNGCHFANNIFKRIFLNENCYILIKISLRFISKGSINNMLALVQIMAWCQIGEKAIIWTNHSLVCWCITEAQWVNWLAPGRCGSNFKT